MCIGEMKVMGMKYGVKRKEVVMNVRAAKNWEELGMFGRVSLCG